jgi:folate-binding Fe-S cluster repair protein YgfZ
MTPPVFSDQLAAEYRALTQTWGLVDVSDRTRIELTGRDRASFLNGFCTNDIQRLEPGHGCEAFLTNLKGRTIGHVFVTCGHDSLVLETVPGQAETILAHLDRYLIREDVQLLDRTQDWGECSSRARKRASKSASGSRTICRNECSAAIGAYCSAGLGRAVPGI